MSTTQIQAPKAFVFDVFGTVVNWRQSLALSLASAAHAAAERTADDKLTKRVEGMTHTDWEWFAADW